MGFFPCLYYSIGDPQPTVRWHREDGEDITMRTVNGERLRCEFSDDFFLHLLQRLINFFHVSSNLNKSIINLIVQHGVTKMIARGLPLSHKNEEIVKQSSRHTIERN